MNKTSKQSSKTSATIEETFLGRVKRLSLNIQDVPIYKSPEDKDTLVGNKPTVFGTMQVYMDSKKKVKNVNFTYLLDHNKELRNHMFSMITEALKLHDKQLIGETK